MKKQILLSIFSAFTFLIFSLTTHAVEVTFRVDMSEETVSPLGVHIAGSFQGWDPGANEMTLTQNNIYVYTADLTEGEEIEYKFVNGNAWGMDEQVPPGCAQNGNRFLTVPANNIELEAVCFGSCTVCNPGEVEITFQVDMSNETVSPDGVHIAGTFQEWNPASTEMLPIGDDVYALTISLEIGSYHEYKFINGNDWGFDETVPQECASGWNRYLTVPEVPTTLEAVCFGSCYPCGPPPIDINVTFEVDMSEQVVSPNGVHIGGGFQGWDPGATEMTMAGDNIYTYTTVLPSGTYQEYKFINGTTWEESENVPPECGVNNNRYLTVPWNDTIIEAVCYGECGPCGPPPVDVDVTFRVDMSNEEISADGVHVAGTFQGWSATDTPMSDIGDDIYEVTLTMQSGVNHEYKFVNGNSFDFVEDVPEECGVPDGQGGFNRFFTVPVEDTTMQALCFGSCDPCGPPLPDHEVTFRVDMSYEDISPDGVHLTGTFQGWDPGSTEMILTTDNIYEVTLMLQEGIEHEFKYINGNTFADAETVPPDCSQNNNRYLTVPANDTTLVAVCFGSCEPCGPPPVDVEITFLVDLEFETVSADGVHITGDFQDWDPGATEMQWIEDNLYAYTTILSSGTYQEFKFVNGDEWGEDEFVPGDCSNNGNRYFTVPETNDTLTAFCFGYCVSCDLVGMDDDPAKASRDFDFWPNPASHQLYFYNAHNVSIFSVDGKLIRKENINSRMMDVSGLERGLYYLLITTDVGSQYKKLIINH